jgi:dolichol-phosphate mannosyltransferase
MDKSTAHISIVTPVYGCANMLQSLYDRLVLTLAQITQDFEIIMVNDDSGDNAWDEIKKLSKIDSRVKGINLSRNFGQHRAITAGLDYAQGDWVVVMDCDLQDQPEEIIKLYNKAQEGYDIVWGQRVQRQDSFFKKTSSKLFHIIYNYFTELNKDETIANFSIVSHQVINQMLKMKEQNRNYPIFVEWLGFKSTQIPIKHASRECGKSSYTFNKLINMAIDNIVSQSNKPLKLSIKFGFSISLLSVLYAIYLIIRYFIYKTPIEGWTSVMVSIYFIGGLLFANLGVLGLYIGKIFDETKDRPLYIVRETTNLERDIND